MKLRKLTYQSKYKTVRPNRYKEIWGINDASAINRNKSLDSYDYVGTLPEVLEYESMWCGKGCSALDLVMIQVIAKSGFKGQYVIYM